MATNQNPKINLAAQDLLGQFRGLNPNDPASWPALPRAALCLVLMAAIVVALWF
jgi:type IV pilus assembly protein PilO